MSIHKQKSLIGFTFRPTDEQIIGFYLKILCTTGPQSLPHKALEFLPDIDIYGEVPPWEICMQFPESRRDNFYVFTKLKKLSKNRIARSASNKIWTWKGQSSRKRITAVWKGDVMVGEKKTLSFMEHGVTTHWNMNEYSLLEINGRKLTHEVEIGQYVICHVTYSYRRDGEKNMISKRPRMTSSMDNLNSHDPLMTSQNCQFHAVMEPGSTSGGGRCGEDRDSHEQQLSHLPSQVGMYMEQGSSSAAMGGGHNHHQLYYLPSQVGALTEQGSSSAAGGQHSYDASQSHHWSSLPPLYQPPTELPSIPTPNLYGDHQHQQLNQQHSHVASQSHQSPTPNIDDDDVYISLDMLDNGIFDGDHQQLQKFSAASEAAPATEGLTWEQLGCTPNQDVEKEGEYHQ